MVNYNVNPLGGFNPGAALQGLGDQFRQQREKDDLKTRREQMQGLMLKARQGDGDAMDQVFALNPEIGMEIDNHFNKMTQEKGIAQAKVVKKHTLQGASEWLSSTPEQRPALKKRFFESEKIDFGEDEQNMTDEQFDMAARLMIHKEFGVGAGGKSATKVGAASPKDFTVDSISTYEKSGDIADLVRFSPKTVKVAGVNHQLNPETQKWEPIVDATSKKLTTQAEALANIAADKKSREDFAKSKTKWRVGKPKFRSMINSSKASQDILQATADQIKTHVNGLTTKYGASLSAIPGSEARTLANQINTLKAHSAFSTLTDLKASGGTLGAISGAELVLLESKLGALDQKGDSNELIRVVDQILNSNLSSIDRLETEFDNTDSMYSRGFDDLQNNQAQKNAVNWSDL